jgi:hypothetical protein
VVLSDQLGVGLGACTARRTRGIVKQFRHSPPVVDGATLNSTYTGFVVLPLVVVPVSACPLPERWLSGGPTPSLPCLVEESPFCRGSARRDP